MVSKLREIVKDGKLGVLQCMGHKSWTWLRHGTTAKHGYTFFPCNENFKIESLSELSTVEHHPERISESRQNAWQDKCTLGLLTISTMLLDPQDLFHNEALSSWPFYPFTTSNTTHSVTTNLFSVSMSALFYGLFFLLGSMYKWDHNI